jgi:diacylglycerol kinase
MGRLIKSFGYALEGIISAFKAERNFKIHVAAAFLSAALGLYLGLSVVEWCLLVFAIGFVLVSELFNTALERLSDEASGGHQSRVIKAAKDISAAAVLLSAVTALVIGILLLFIPFVQSFFD